MKKYKNYVITLLIILTAFAVLCFIPISASKMIPVVEKQVAENLGADVHLEHLVLRIGPKLKAKTPIVHLMYEDGQKFAQMDSVKFYIPWGSVLKNKPIVKTLQAKNLTVRVNSDDKFLPELLNNISNKDYSELPNIDLKNYKISYLNKNNGEIYTFSGSEMILNKLIGCKNFKLVTKGDLQIDGTQYINYDISILPKFDRNNAELKYDMEDLFNKLKLLDFHSDIIADLKLYKNQEESILASGFVNIDNMSVLDKTGKNPKSFIYMTLWGDKASILSNIYASQNKKVYLEGMINNSKKPVLDLKVKTDEIELSSLYNKLKIFADFSALKNIDSVSGMLSANFTLKGDLNKLKSNGFLKISDAEVKAGGVKVSKINADIDFSNNIINIANAVGYVNSAPIMLKGNIDKNINLELLMSKVELKNLLPEAYGIKNGIISLVANINGTFDNPVHKENLRVDNLVAENNQKSVSIESIKLDTNKNNTAYINNVNIKSGECENIKIPSMRLLVDRDIINLPETNIYMPNSKVIVKGSATNYANKNLSYVLSSEGFINSSDLKCVKLNSTRYPIKLNLSGGRLVQNINAQVLFEKAEVLDEPAIINMSLKINKDKISEKLNLKIDDISVLSFSGKLSNDFKANLRGVKKLTINGIAEDIKNSAVLKNIRVTIPQMLELRLADTILQLKGDVFVNGNYKNPEMVGQLYIQNLFNQPSQLSLTNCAIDFNKNIVSINAPSVKIADSSMGITSSLYTDISRGIRFKNLNIKSKFVNTDTILMYKDVPLRKSYPVEVLDGKFYSERVLADLYGSPVYVTAFSSDFNLKDNKLSLKNMASEIFNGKFSGAMDYNLKDETFESRIMARSVSASPIFDIISSRKDNISGVMDFDSFIKGNILSKKSLNGDIKFIVHNGRMSTLGKLEHLLYAQNVVADNMLRTSLSIVTKAITLKDTGLFKYLKGDVAMKDGVAEIKMMQSLGPLMSLYIKGQYNPENDNAKLVVLGRISDEIVSGLGAFGDFSLNKLMIMLTGEENKYNIMPADIENLPQLPVKNTKEFRSVINGVIDKPSSVQMFNWISYSEKSLRQKDVPMTNLKVPSFVEELPY